MVTARSEKRVRRRRDCLLRYEDGDIAEGLLMNVEKDIIDEDFECDRVPQGCLSGVMEANETKDEREMDGCLLCFHVATDAMEEGNRDLCFEVD